MALRAGSLNRLIRFERRADAANEFNEQVGEWVEFARAYAQVVSLNAREFFASMQAQSEATLRIVVRHTPQLASVKTTDRIAHGERVFDITSPPLDPDGRGRELHFFVAVHDDEAPL